MAVAPTHWNRRSLLTAGGALVASRFGLTERGASAGRGWCRSDPVLLIDGVLADLFSAVPLDCLLKVTGPTQIAVTAPQSVKLALAIPGLGFLRGEKVTFERSAKLEKTADGIELNIAVYVPARDNFDVEVDFAPRILGILKPEKADGRTNDWIKLKTRL